MYIKTNDTVQVVAGKDKGKTGKVVKIDRAAGKVVVEGVNVVKRHKRPTAADQQGGIIEKTAPISISNVMLFSAKLQRGVRVSYRYVGASGEYHATSKAAKDSFGTQAPERLKKVRLCLKTGEVF
jgi:large subunit ribosomal protein L24